MARLFGTDGIRGIVNDTLTGELAYKVGVATATVMKNRSSDKPNFIIGTDTRKSRNMLKSAIICGLTSVGSDVVDLGVIPTPAVAYLAKEYGAAGIMITASHNPSKYNGIKIFSSDGYKLPDEVEEEIEEIIADVKSVQLVSDDELGDLTVSHSARDKYIKHLISTVDCDLSSLNVAIDAANGAASNVALKLFHELGVNAVICGGILGSQINENCGSTHMENIQSIMKANSYDIGIAFDGDADRCLFVDENGEIVDGDYTLAIVSKYFKEQGCLEGNSVVGTVMSNFGFTSFCKQNDINFVATKVGDRYVLEEMLLNDYILGGEQSGHIIFKEHATTGDGLLTALNMLMIMKKTGKPLSELKKVMTKYPQVMDMVEATSDQKVSFLTNNLIKKEIASMQELLNGDGRILVRPSGTENYIRVMAEGKSSFTISAIVRDLCNLIAQQINK